MTLSRRATLLCVVFLAFSALAQNEILVASHASAFEAAAAGKTSMLALFTKHFLAAPCACGEIDAMRVGFDGQSLGAPFRIASSFLLQEGPAIAFDGVRFLATWIELPAPPLNGPPQPPLIFGAFVSEDGSVSAPFTIAAAEVNRPVIVWDGTQYVVLYTKPDATAVGVTVSAQGIVGTPFPAGDQKQIVSAAAGGSQIAVVSVRGDKQVEARILGGAVRVLGSGANEAVIAWNGRTFLVAWTQNDGVYASTFDGEPHLIAADDFPRTLRLVASGPLFLAAWDGTAVSTAWIDAEPFGVMANIDNNYERFSREPHDPLLVAIPGESVALFYTRYFFPNQFTIFGNEYVSLVKPGRRRAAPRHG